MISIPFNSIETSSYPILISDSDSSASCGGSSYVYPTQVVSSTELVGTYDLSGCSGIIVFTLYYKGDTQGGLSANVAVVFSVTDTSKTQGIQSDSTSLSITGNGFYDTSTDNYLVWIRTDDTSCSAAAYRPTTVGSNTITVNNISVSDCTNNPQYVYAQLSRTGLGQLASVAVATFDLVTITDTSTSQGVYDEVDETVTVTGIGFYDSDTSLYNFSYTCDGVTTSVATSALTHVSVDTMTIVLDLSSCTSDVDLSLVYDNTTSVNATSVASIVSITDTKFTQALSSETDRTITITGRGFGSDTLTDYEILFIAGGCALSSSTFYATSRTSSTEIYVANVDTRNCTGILLASLNYRSYGALNTKSIATFAKIVDTETSYGYSALTSSQNITIEGIGFSDSNCDNYNITVNATNCADSLSTYTCSDVSYDVMTVSNVSLLECQGTVSAFITMSSLGIELSEVNIGQIISLDDTSTVQVNTQSVDEVITIFGDGFMSSNLSDYEVTLSYTSVSSSSTTTSTLTPTNRVSSRELHVTANLTDAQGVVSISSFSLSSVESVKSVDVSTIIKLSESYATYGLIVGETITVSIQGEGFVSTSSDSYEMYLSFGDINSTCTDTTPVGAFTPTYVSNTYLSYNVSLANTNANCTHVYANLTFNPESTSSGDTFGSKSIAFTNIASIGLISVFDTETTQAIQSVSGFPITISGTGFFISDKSKYKVRLQGFSDSGVSCTLEGKTPSTWNSQLSITVTEDLSACT